MDTVLPELQAVLGDRLVTSEADRTLHGQNETYYPVTPPDAVAYPESTEEVSAILRLCNRHGVPVTAYGAASSLEGQHLAVQGGISLDMGRMSRVLTVNAEDLNAVVQPGITRKRLNEELRATGLFFPVDPGADASIGGMAATRASGDHGGALWHDAREYPRAGGGDGGRHGDPHRQSGQEKLDRV